MSARLLAPVLALSLAFTACDSAPPSIAPDTVAAPPAATSVAAAPVRPAPRAPAATRPAVAEETWNAAQIAWQPYEAGLASAKAQKKPVCLVLYTNWCPHCRTYSNVFDDAKVVERARDFVMVRINADEESEIAKKYARDGGYVPRTYFLAPDGTIEADIKAARDKFVYFYDERDPASLLAGMSAALLKHPK